MDEIIGPIYDRRDYAGFIRRTIAFVIDILVLSIMLLVPVVCLQMILPNELAEEKIDAWTNIAFNVSFVIYFIGFRLSARGTPGYRLMRIHYVYMLGPKPTALVRVFRAFAAALLVWIFAIDHLWILFDERKQAWHDKITGFYVVKRKAQPAGQARMVQRVINFMGMALLVWEPTEEERFSTVAGHDEPNVATPACT